MCQVQKLNSWQVTLHLDSFHVAAVGLEGSLLVVSSPPRVKATAFLNEAPAAPSF